MYLPNMENAIIAEAKITRYLLDLSSKKGKAKAEFFGRFGFTLENWQVFEEALRKHAQVTEVTRVQPSDLYGTYYVIEGLLISPDGRNPFVRVVWLIDEGDVTPRLISVIPLTKGGTHASHRRTG